MNTLLSDWQLLVISLPTNSTTLRMRLWRALKALGCAALRDGAYLLPRAASLDAQMQALADEVGREQGTAWLLGVRARSEEAERSYRSLFDRSADYREWRRAVATSIQTLATMTGPEIQRSLRKLRRDHESLRAIDYFPNEASEEAQAAWSELVKKAELCLSPGEPQARDAALEMRDPAAYRARTWATRRRLWVDRVASAWLIRRFIDQEASFLWLDSPRDCPPHALGFDFDGAAFTHIGPRVTFEVLAASFGLENDPGMARLGAMERALDVGAGFIPEAGGFEAVLTGARQRLVDDDALLAEISGVLDSLYTYFSTEPNPN
jgi:hypothetical protein